MPNNRVRYPVATHRKRSKKRPGYGISIRLSDKPRDTEDTIDINRRLSFEELTIRSRSSHTDFTVSLHSIENHGPPSPQPNQVFLDRSRRVASSRLSEHA
jgi:hypothetical protein